MTSKPKGTDDLEEAFRRDPSDPDAFSVLRRVYQSDGDGTRLAELFERRAAHMHDAQKAADLLWQAAEAHARAKDQNAELRVLRKAAELHRGNLRVLERLRTLCRERGHWLEVIQLLDAEADVARGASDAKRLARAEHDAGQVWEKEYGRLDRAIQHYQQAFKADPTRTDSIEAGRRIYSGLGHWKTVASLYQVELETCGDAKRRVELLLQLAKLSWEKLADLEAAAKAFNEASQLRASDETILESLGELYASPEWPSPGGLEKAAGIFMQIAQRRQGRGDRDGAIPYLRRALGAHPESEPAFNRLERVYEETGRFEDLDRLYRQRLSVTSGADAIALQRRRAELLDRKLGDRKGARETFEALLEQEPPGGNAATRLLELYRADGEWEKVAWLLRRILEATGDTSGRIRLLLELAALQRDHLGDPEGAAHILYQVLELEPGNRKALAAYEDYYRQKGDYRNLAELLRFAAQTGRETGAPPMEICARLEELAEVSERRLGDMMGAVEAWQQIAEIHPDVQRSNEALDRLAAKIHTWQGMVQMLDRELASAVSPGQRLQALRRSAQLYFEKKADPLRCIEILREILNAIPTDEAALRMLVELYEREADHNGLAWALERQLGGILTKPERMAALRRLAEIYADKLDRPAEALNAYNALMELHPNDARVHEKIQALLEKTEDLEHLSRFLEYRAKASHALADRVGALRTLAQLTDLRLENPARAAGYWEEVRALDPTDEGALEALTRLYDRTGRQAELLEILRRRLELLGEGSPVVRANLLRQLAVVAEERLGRDQDAVWAYEQLSILLPGDRETLDALARLHTRLERHGDLVRVLGRQIELCDDVEQSVALAFKQADLLEEKLQDHAGAALIFEHIIADYAPSDLDAHRRLKEIYLGLGNYQRACQVAERELFLTDDADDKLTLALEIASIWRDKAKDEQRAAACYERVLEIDKESSEALQALRRIYHRIGAYTKLQKLAPALFASLPDNRERQVLLVELGQVSEEQLRDPDAAFNWYRRAYDLYPEDGVGLTNLRRLAQAHELWEDLLNTFAEARKRVTTREQALDFTREMAGICELQLRDPARAFEVLQQGLEADRAGEEILDDLERLAEASGQHRQLLAVYDQVLGRTADPARQVELLRRRAAIAEGSVVDPAAALESYIRLNAIAPDDEDVLDEIERLAGQTGRWEEALQVHERRYRDAGRPEQRLGILAHTADVIEHQMGDLARAFRVHLHALALQPEEQEVFFHLWRLAGLLHAALGSEAAPQPVRPAELAKSREVSFAAADSSESMELSMDMVVEEGLVIEPTKRRRPDGTIDDPTMLDNTPSGVPTRITASPFAPPPPPARGPALPGRPPPPPGMAPFAPGGPVLAPWAELANAYQSLPAADAVTRLRRLIKVAEIWSAGAGQIDLAFEALAEAAQIDVEHPELERHLKELADAHDCFDRRLEIYLDAIDRAAEAGGLIRLHLHVAELLIERGRLDEGEQHLSAVLTVQPQNAQAAGRLIELYRSHDRWQDLADLKERQLEVLAPTLPSAERAQRLRELADLYQHTLHRPFETVDYLTRLAAEDPTNLEVQGRLADLYEELSIWPRLIEVLQGMLELTMEVPVRVELLLRMGRTFEDELELPDRAIETYRAALQEEPHSAGALVGLDRLYETHHRTAELADVLRLRAELSAADPGLQRLLCIRLATVLEARGDAPALEEAIRCLEQARKLGQFDADVEEALARNLVKVGQADTAVQRLREQVMRGRSENRAPEQIAALLTRLARIQTEQLSDLAGARASLEEARQLLPAGREVLQALAEFYQRTESWSELLPVLIRLAESEPATAVPFLLRAAELARDQLKDRGQAVTLLERVLELDPALLPAIDALLKLTVEDLDRRESLLRLRLDLVETPGLKAETMSALGRVLTQRGAPDDAAQVLYKEALRLDPSCVAALDGMSELLMRRGEVEPARSLLESALEQLALENRRGPAMGTLFARLAMLHETLKRDDDAHRCWQDALRFDPGNLSWRISIVMNRHRGGQFRDALRHVQELSGKIDGGELAERAADALHAGGQCETALRRPERAAAYYEEALRLNPRHAPSLRDLTRIALAGSEWTRALELLERQLPLASAEERPGVLRSLGELCHEHTGDEAAAARWFEELHPVLPRDEATRLEVLPRILPVLRKAGRHAAAAAIADELAQLLGSRDQMREMLLIASEEHAAAGNRLTAERQLDAVLRLDPRSLEAATRLAELLEAGGRLREVCDLLKDFLGAAPVPVQPAERATQARLYAELGRVQAGVDDRRAAIAAYERSLELDDQLVVRESLSALYGDDPEHAAHQLENHRRMLAGDPGRVASLRLVTRAALGQPDRARPLLQALEILGELDDAGRDYLATNPAPALEVDAPYPGELTEEDRRAFLTCPEVHGLDEVFALLWEAAPSLLTRNPGDFGVGPGERVSPVAQTDLARVFSACARALGIKLTSLYAKAGAAKAIQVLGMAPPAIVVDSNLAEGRSVSELRFLLGRGLELTHGSYILAAGLERTDFARLLSSVLRAFHPRHMRGRRDLGGQAVDQANQLRKAMPFKIARQLSELFRERANMQFDSGRWRQAVLRSANRAGLALCGDLSIALRLSIEDDPALAALPLQDQLRTSPVVRDLFAFAIGDGYVACRAKLGQTSQR